MSDTEGVPEGSRLFARYAYAPNALGYCGPAGVEGLQAVASGGGAGVDVPRLARQFSGAWPYQQILAEIAGVADPLDARVVRGYWTGNELTDQVDRVEFGARLIDRVAARAGRYWTHLDDSLLAEAAPTHAFHVFGVYPWSRLLTTRRPEPLHVLDSCRIRWGTVREVRSERLVVRARALLFDGARLSLGPEQDEPVRHLAGSVAFVDDLHRGDLVAVHWGLACDRLSAFEAERLQYWTRWQLEATNHRLAEAS